MPTTSGRNGDGRRGTPGAERAVYGLRVTGLDRVAELDPVAVAAASDVVVEVLQSDGPPPPPAPNDGSSAVLLLPNGRHLALDRQAATATLYGPPIPPDEVAHPYLGLVAATFNRWVGREAFHAGAFVAGGRAWVVNGVKEAGKSTLMAALAGRGVPVLCDDMAVTDGEFVYAGPRCVDLRRPLPQMTLPVAPARAGQRLRVVLPPSPQRVPLGGWVFLGWGSPAMNRVGPDELLGRVGARRCWSALPSDPMTLLHLATHPAWDFTRAKDWAVLDPAVDLLMGTVLGARPPERDAA